MHELLREFYKKLGNNIYKARKERKMSANDLGKRIGVTTKTVRRYELGEIKVSYEKMLSIAQALQVDYDRLYSESKSALSVEDLAGVELTYKGKPIEDDRKKKVLEMLSRILDMSE